MAVDDVLERLIDETDAKLQAKESIDRKDMIKKYTEDRIEQKVYNSFLEKYTNLKTEYLKEKDYLTNMEEQKMDYDVIGWNTFWGAMIGYNTVRSVITAFIGAAIGGGMTYYNQKKNADMDLGDLFWWTLIGGWIGKGLGSQLEPAYSDYFAILGQSVGCGLAILKELRKVRPELTPEEKAMKLQALEAKHPQDIEQLLQTTKIEYMNKVTKHSSV